MKYRLEKPTGIIRTLPSLYGDASESARRFQDSIDRLEEYPDETVSIALQAIPIIEVIHVYLLVDGKINVRLNLVEYETGDTRECFDKTYRKPKFWATCTSPVSRPLEPIKRRGFQGFRYTTDLW